MRRLIAGIAVFSAVVTAVVAGTNTPYPPGTTVTVTTTTGQITGTLQDSPEPEWIRLTEAGRSSFTAVRLGSVSIVQQSGPAAADASVRVVPEADTADRNAYLIPRRDLFARDS